MSAAVMALVVWTGACGRGSDPVQKATATAPSDAAVAAVAAITDGPVAASPPAGVAPPPAPLEKPCLSFATCTESCERNVGQDCNRLGQWYQHGWNVPKDSDRVRALEKKACDLGYPDACGLDSARRLALVEAGCAAKIADHCGNLGYTLLLPRLKIEPRDLSKEDIQAMTRGVAAQEQGCELGSPLACENRIRWLTSTFSAHSGARDYDRHLAEQLVKNAERACRRGDAHWCEEMTNGDRVDDEAERKRYHRRAADLWVAECEAGYVDSCLDAAPAIHDFDEKASARMRARRCELGDSTACRDKPVGPKSKPRAR